MEETPAPPTTSSGTDSDLPAPGARRAGLLRRLYDWVLGWADTPYGTPALALLSFAESSFFPIPPDPLLMALAVGKVRRAFRYALVCTVASVVGGLFGYWIGHGAFDLIGQRIIDAYGLEQQYEVLREKFQEYAFLSILGAGFTPIPYKVFTIAAGSFGVDLGTFVIASLLGRGGRFFLVAILIRLFGEPIKDLIDRYFNLLALAFFALLVVGFLVVKWLV